ncbi:MAG: hypothetical protein ACK4UW_19045 [Rhizobium rhizophilum]|uniref:hypothetical protein n=1 Tax=Rhizobium rhizophilum TaxID=1850373 RepID=UPI00391A5A31
MPEQRKSCSQHDPQTEAEEAATERASHQQHRAPRTIGSLCRKGVGDDADIAGIEAHLGRRFLTALEHGLVNVACGFGLALQLAELDQSRRIGRLGCLLDVEFLEDVGLFLLRRFVGAAGGNHHALEFKADLPFDIAERRLGRLQLRVSRAETFRQAAHIG